MSLESDTKKLNESEMSTDFGLEISDVFSIDPQQYAEMLNQDFKPDESRVEPKNNMIDCIYCSFRSTSAKAVQDHLEEYHICDVCQQIFEDKLLLQKHIKAHVEEAQKKEFNYPCPYCEQRFLNNPQLFTHIKTSHISDISIRGDEKGLGAKNTALEKNATVSLSGNIIPLEDILNFCNRRKQSGVIQSRPDKRDEVTRSGFSRFQPAKTNKSPQTTGKIPCYNIYLNNSESKRLKKLYLDDKVAESKYYFSKVSTKKPSASIVRFSGPGGRTRRLVTSTVDKKRGRPTDPALNSRIEPAHLNHISENKALAKLWEVMQNTELTNCEEVPTLNSQLDKLLESFDSLLEEQEWGILPPLVVNEESEASDNTKTTSVYTKDNPHKIKIGEKEESTADSLKLQLDIKTEPLPPSVPLKITLAEPLPPSVPPKITLAVPMPPSVPSKLTLAEPLTPYVPPKLTLAVPLPPPILPTLPSAVQARRNEKWVLNKKFNATRPNQSGSATARAVQQNILEKSPCSTDLVTEENLKDVSQICSNHDNKANNPSSRIEDDEPSRKRRRKSLNPVQKIAKPIESQKRAVAESPLVTETKATTEPKQKQLKNSTKTKSRPPAIQIFESSPANGALVQDLADEFCASSTDSSPDKLPPPSNNRRKRSTKTEEKTPAKKQKADKKKSFVDVKLAKIPDENPYAKKAQSFRKKRNSEVQPRTINDEIPENLKRSMLEPYCDVCEILLERSQDSDKISVSPTIRIPDQSVVWIPQRTEKAESASDNICQTFPVSKLLVCVKCKVCVHAACYQTDKDCDEWRCDRCSANKPNVKTHATCYLCNGRNRGALKFSDKNKHFYHIRCAILIPELSQGCGEVDMSAVPRRRWNMTCLVCDQAGKEPAIHCMASKECMLSFHLSCAYSSGTDCALGPDNTVILRCAFCIDRFQLKETEEKCKYPSQDIDVGEKVEVLNHPGLKEGVIVAVDEEIVYSVAFDDGSFCDSVEPENVTLCDQGDNVEMSTNAPVKISWEGELFSGIFKEQHTVYWYKVKAGKAKGKKTLELARSDLVKKCS